MSKNQPGQLKGKPGAEKGPQSKVKAVERVVVKSERKFGSAHMQEYCRFLVAPYDSEDVVEAPSITPVRRTTVRQNIVKDLSTFNNGGGFYIEANPSIVNTLNLTSAVADTRDQGGMSFDLGVDNGGVVGVAPSRGRCVHTTTGYIGSMVDITDAGGTTLRGFQIDSSATAFNTDMYFGLDPTSIEVQVTISVYGLAAAGNWAPLAASVGVTSVGLNGRALTAAVTIPANCVGIAFLLGVTGQPYTIPLGLAVQASAATVPGTGTWRITQNKLLRDSFGLPLQQAISDLQSWNVTAQDILVSFEGDTLQDGGSIACARVPRSWTPITSDPYSEILALPYDRMDGPLKYGCHVHWIPGSLDDISPVDDPIDDANFGTFKMVVAGQITHPGASVRVRVCTAVAYYSDNPSYGRMDWAPPAVDYSLLLQYVARVVPAATQNDVHVIRKIAALAGKHARQGLQYLAENPALLAKIMTAFAAAL